VMLDKRGMSMAGVMGLTATVVTVTGSLLIGGIWLGDVSSMAKDNKAKLGAVQEIKTDQAVIKERIKNINKQLTGQATMLNNILTAIKNGHRSE
jgi:hypothetical protein